jgi:glycosyltransferase involved in cell wall biosynthesis
MKISLLVPCFNAGRHLPRLWETVRNQTRPFDECLCYDDASTDDTTAVAAQLGARVIRGERQAGPAAARNQLWQAATGDWVHFHDADDLLHPDFAARMTSLATHDVDAVVCDVAWVAEEARTPMIAFGYKNALYRDDPVGYVLEHPIGGINGLYRREVLRSVGGFDEQLVTWEDADLHVRLAAAGARFAFAEEILCTALRHGGGVSTDAIRNWQNRLSALLRYETLLPARARPALAREAERTALHFAGLGQKHLAQQAIALARRLGARPPTSRSPGMALAKIVVPAYWLLRLRARARRVAAH